VYAGTGDVVVYVDPDEPCGSVKVPGFPVYGLTLSRVLQLFPKLPSGAER